MAKPTYSAPKPKDQHKVMKGVMDDLNYKMCELHKEITENSKESEGVRSLRVHKNQLLAKIAQIASQLEKISKKSHDLALEMSTWIKKVENKRESINELRLMVAMYDREGDDQRNPYISRLKLRELRGLSEVERLREGLEIPSLESRLKIALENKAASEQRLATKKSGLSSMSHKVNDSKRDIARLVKAFEIKNEDVAAFGTELETTIDTYEGTITSNRRLIDQLKEEADKSEKLVSEMLEAKNVQATLSTENRLLASQLENISAMREKGEPCVAQLDKEVKSYSDEISRATNEGTLCSERLEEVNLKRTESEKELLTTKTALETGKTESQTRACELLKIQSKLEKERRKKHKVESESAAIASVPSKKGTYTSLGTSSQDPNQRQISLIGKLEREAQAYRERIKCFVCLERTKEVLITTCYHLFCGPCIQETLKCKWNDKGSCPICGTFFKENHVKRFYV